MTDDTEPGLIPAQADPHETYGYCYWHRGPAATILVVDAIERASAAPYPLTACRSCREQRNLEPPGA